MRGIRTFRVLAVLLSFTFVAASCGDDDDGGDGATTDTEVSETTAASEDGSDTTEPEGETTTSLAALTASFRGVTEDTIKIGVAMIDFQQLYDAGFVPETFGDQERSYQAVIDEINENGGILGRQIEPVYQIYFPVPGDPSMEEMCLKFTEDEEVFAVVGVVLALYPTLVDCIAGVHETVLITHEQTQELMDQYSETLFSPDIVADRRLAALLSVLDQNGDLGTDRTIGIFGTLNDESRVNDAVLPLLEEYGYADVEVGLVDNSGAIDINKRTADAQVIAERFRAEGVDTILLVGIASAARVPAVKQILPDVEMWIDTSSGLLDSAQKEEDQSAFDGILTIEGLGEDDGEAFNHPSSQRCKDIFTARVPDIPLIEGADEQDANWWNGVRDACNELFLFVAAAEAAGAELTNDSFVEGLESLGSIELVAKTAASFGPGKHDGEDGFRLVRYSSTVGDKGGFEALTDLFDINAG